MSTSDKAFSGSIAQLYDKYLVPLIFQPYADDLARRVAAHAPSSVLEIAAGTGVVTRAMAKMLPSACAIVATDLNPPMLEQARAVGTARPVEWRPADAMKLPFDDAKFDVVACQFGAMFFPDRPAAYREARRVLRPGGALAYNVWDRIEDNVFALVATSALGEMFPANPPLFMRRTPHGYFDVARIAEDFRRAGFADPRIETVTHTSRAKSARDVAIAYCQGTPLRNEIEACDPKALDEGRIQAHVIVAARE
jgi:ubiquinone/menaquinone biosynthesis C-methylase UbiE